MSEYSWYLPKMWVGIVDDREDKYGGPLIGVVIRSARVRALGHFCHCQVSLNGRRVWASGAEDRIFPFHSVNLTEIGGTPPKDMKTTGLGWATDGNRYCFRYGDRIVEVGRAATAGYDEGLVDVDPTLWKAEWKSA